MKARRVARAQQSQQLKVGIEARKRIAKDQAKAEIKAGLSKGFHKARVVRFAKKAKAFLESETQKRLTKERADQQHLAQLVDSMKKSAPANLASIPARPISSSTLREARNAAFFNDLLYQSKAEPVPTFPTLGLRNDTLPPQRQSLGVTPTGRSASPIRSTSWPLPSMDAQPNQTPRPEVPVVSTASANMPAPLSSGGKKRSLVEGYRVPFRAPFFQRNKPVTPNATPAQSSVVPTPFTPPQPNQKLLIQRNSTLAGSPSLSSVSTSKSAGNSWMNVAPIRTPSMSFPVKEVTRLQSPQGTQNLTADAFPPIIAKPTSNKPQAVWAPPQPTAPQQAPQSEMRVFKVSKKPSPVLKPIKSWYEDYMKYPPENAPLARHGDEVLRARLRELYPDKNFDPAPETPPETPRLKKRVMFKDAVDHTAKPSRPSRKAPSIQQSKKKTTGFNPFEHNWRPKP